MRLQAVDTHLVVALHALLQERSVTRAARRIGVTQPTMSHSLARLRVLFDDPLLVQVGKSMVLTERARALVPKVGLAVEHLERVFGPDEHFDPKRSARTFRLAATDNLELLVFPRLAHMLAAEAPFIDLRCRSVPKDWPDLLRRGELDAKLGREGPVPTGCRSLVLAREGLVCVMRRGHRAAKQALTAERYASLDHLLVAPHGGEQSPVDRALAERGLRRRVAMTVSHFLVAPFIVACSDLVLTISARVAEKLAAQLNITVKSSPVLEPGYELTLVWPERLDQDEGHQFLRSAIVRAVK